MTGDMIVRFAPSPTGKLHVGNIRAAIFNKLFALKTGGRFLLRLDDTDTERSKPEFAQAIEADLRWLGLHWDGFARQSDRTALYDRAAVELKAKGILYPAYETAEELDRRRKRQAALGRPPVYDRASLNLLAEERARLEAEGRKPHWRFKLPDGAVTWTDLIRGEVSIRTNTLSDPVLIRADGSYLYTFTSVVDDIDHKISHIIRGEDHVTNTAVQIAIFEALGATPPAFAHYALLVGAGGEALSKRLGSLSVESLRAEGIEPEAILSLLAKLGTADPVVPRLGLGDLAKDFSLDRIGRAPAHFDPAELRTLNAKILHAMPYDQAKGRLPADIDLTEAAWSAIHDNLETMEGARDWHAILTRPLEPTPQIDHALTEAAAKLLPEGTLTAETWGPWTKALSEATGRKGRDLFQPLRLALTGRPHGPEMKKLLPLLGRARVLARLRGQRA